MTENFFLTLEKALIAGFQVEPFNTDTRNRRQRTVLPVQSRNSHIRKLPSLIQTVLNRAYPFSERKKKMVESFSIFAVLHLTA